MKIFYTLILSLCAVSVLAQTNITKHMDRDAYGDYFFYSATISVRNHESKAEILTQTFNDTTSLKNINEFLFPAHPIFLSASIQSGKLSACTLWNDRKEYIVVDNVSLLPARGSEKDIDIDTNPEMDYPFPFPYTLSPLHTLTIEGNTATFTFPEIYGNSQYNFTLEGTLTIVLVREQPYRRIL